MKKAMWIPITIIAVAGVAALVASFRMGDIETPDYKVVKTIGDVEIREYPKMIVAKTSLTSSSFDNSGSNGFRTIAGYIFGGNQGNQKIAMTSPVVMNMGDSATMYFVMPKQYQKEQLPTPNSASVEIVEEAPKTLAVIKYGGFSSDEKIKRYCKKLEGTLTQNSIQWKGGFMYMGYNAPWDVVNRRNEVAVEVQLKTQ
ncbi:MAG: heme-binding protein [Bacteroidetes bacterium]|nr:heme-binding protein [Bacteroidota bacterium]